ncbi:RING finger protein 17-like isoform X2 [Arctopsyche grandis]|uniref:RING finger protein 17-like isoform X2 n=1 Tax=Arctopsyche grandis TaxID=121162 RepID=UPI00406D7DF7
MESLPCCICKYDFIFTGFNDKLVTCIPYILPCNHSACIECIDAIKYLKHFECQWCETKCTLPADLLELAKKDLTSAFPINFHVLGQAFYKSTKITGRNLASNISLESLEKYSKQLTKKDDSDDHVKEISVPCFECKKQTFSMCPQCNLNLCDTCFKKKHDFSSTKNHLKVELKCVEYFLKSTKCQQHPDKDVDLYCQNCDVNICAYCVILKLPCHNHDVVIIKTKNDEIQEYLKKEKLNVHKVYFRLKKSKREIMKIDKDSSSVGGVRFEITNKFANAHAALQLAEFDMLRDIKEIPKRDLTSIKQSLIESESELSKLVQVMELCFIPALNNLIDYQRVLSSVKKAYDTPRYLSGDSNDPSTPLISVNQHVLTDLKNYCKLNKLEFSSYKLLSKVDKSSDDELESDFIEIKNEICREKILPANSSSSRNNIKIQDCQPPARFKNDDEDNINSIMNKFKTTNTRPAQVAEQHKNVQSQSNDSLRGASKKSTIEVKLPIPGSTEVGIVSHIVNPHEFYVQCTTHQNLIDEISRESFAKHRPVPNFMKPGRVLFYNNPIDQRNYRVYILEHDSTLAKVKFIDYGQIEEIPVKLLYTLHYKYVSVPPLAIKCLLADCAAPEGGWTWADYTYMHTLVKSRICCTVHIKQPCDSGFKVDLMIDGKTNLKEALLVRKSDNGDSIKLQSYEDVSIPESDSVLNGEVVITHIVSPTCFYIRKVSHEKQYNLLSNDMNKMYTGGACEKVRNLKMGQHAACFVLKFNCWSRCCVLNILNEQKVLVRLLDIGMETSVLQTSLYFLQKKFREIDILAKKCSLHMIRPINKTWCNNAIKLLTDCSKSWTPSTVKQMNKKYNVFDVEMQSCINGEILSLGDELVKRGYAQYLKSGKSHLKNNLTYQKKQKIETITKVVPPSEPVHDDFGRIPVKVMLAVSPSEIYIQLISAQALLTEFSANMQKFYETAKPNLKINWKLNDKCAITSSQQGQWCRGLIVELNEEEGTCKVFLKDIAVWEKLDIKDLYELPSQFLTVKDGTFKCFLSGINPALGTQWPNLSCEYLQEITSNYSKYAICSDGVIDNKSLPIQLWVYYTDPGGALEPSIKEWRRVNDMIVHKGLAIWDTNKMEEWKIAEELKAKQVPKIAPHTDEDYKKSLIFDSFKLLPAVQKKWKPSVLRSKDFSGIPTNVDDEFNIYILDLAVKEQLEYVNTYIMEQFENSSPQPEDMFWGPDQPCIAQFSTDNKFYRGLTIKTLENNCMLVRFIDYGNDEVCPISTLRKNIVLEEIPALVLKCRVVGVQPKGNIWEESKLDMIHQTVVEKECFINVLGTNEENDVIYIKLDIPNVTDLATLTITLGIADYCDYPQMLDVALPTNKEAPNVDEDDEIIMDNCEMLPSNLTENNINSDKYTAKPILNGYPKLKFSNSFFKCRVVDVVSFSSVILMISDDRQFSSLHNRANKVFTEIGDKWPHQPLFDPKLGRCCIACAPNDSWYRGEVYHSTIVSDDDPVGVVHTVHFIDLGTSIGVPYNYVREILPNWVEVPPLTITAKLNSDSLADNVDPNDVVAKLKQLMCNRHLHAKIICDDNDVFTVELFTDSTELVLVYQRLIDDGLFVNDV